MPRSQNIGLDYELPANRYINPSQTSVIPEEGVAAPFALPKPSDDLAYVEGLSDKYFDTRSKIEQYTLAMQKDYGIDVTKPDPSQPGGGIPFKTYQKLATNLLVTANDLKTSREDEVRKQAGVISGMIRPVQGFDDKQQPINRVPLDQQFYSTKLLPEVEQANDILKTAVYTDADYNRFKKQVLDPTVAKLTSAMNRPGISPAEKDQLQFNINALIQQPRQEYMYRPFDPNSGAVAKSKSVMTLFEKIANHTRGAFPVGTTEPKIINGQQFLASSDFKGDNFGERLATREDNLGNKYEVHVPNKIRRTLKDKDGNVFFQYENGDMENVSAITPDEVTRRLMESNGSKYGGAAALEMLYNELDKNKVLGEDRAVPRNAVFGKGSDKKTTSRPNIPGFDRIQEVLKKQFEDLANPEKNLGTISVPTADGKIYKFGYDEDEGVYLKNYEELGVNKQSNLSFEEYLQALDEVGAWDKFMKNPPSNNKGGTPTGDFGKYKSVPLETPTGRTPKPFTINPKEGISFGAKYKDSLKDLHPWTIDVGNRIANLVGDTVVFNSLRRTKEENKNVGGKPNSYHLLGAGIDLKFSDWDKIPDKEKTRLMQDFKVDMIIESDHVHLEPTSNSVLKNYGKTPDQIRADELINKYLPK
jgi:hypothetical protein